MRENVGGADRLLRVAIGPAVVLWGWILLSPAERKSGPVALMLTGALLSETALTKVCPVSAVFGIDTTTSG